MSKYIGIYNIYMKGYKFITKSLSFQKETICLKLIMIAAIK